MFKDVKKEVKVAKIIKGIEASILLVIVGLLSYEYYVSQHIFDIILAVFCLWSSYKLMREAQGLRIYTVLNLGFTLGLILYTMLLSIVYFNVEVHEYSSTAILVVLLILLIFSKQTTKLTSKIFGNFNFIARLVTTLSKLGDDEYKEAMKMVDMEFDKIKEKLDDIDNK